MTTRSVLLPCAIMAVLLSSNTVAVEWPGWAKKLEKKLHCGMTAKEIEQVVGDGLSTLSVPRGRFGTHFVPRGNSDLWLDIGVDGLQGMAVLRVRGLKIAELTPKHNLCTGTQSYFLRVNVPSHLIGAVVYVDEDNTGIARNIHYDVEVQEGLRKVRVVKEGLEPIVRSVDATGARGDIVLDLEQTGG